MIIGFINRGFNSNSSWEIIHKELINLLNDNFSVIYLSNDPKAEYDFLFIDSIYTLLLHYNKYNKYARIQMLLETKPVIQVKHDRFTHVKSRTLKHHKLLNKIDQNTLLFFHLSKFSSSIYQHQFKNALHVQINHPNYLDLPNNIERVDARTFLGLNNQQLVFIFFGTPRNYNEVMWLIKSFLRVKNKQKVLIANRNLFAGNFIQRQILKIIIKFNKHITIFNEKTANKNIQLYLKAADFAYLPRFSESNLNSGLFFLYSSFKLPVIIPENSILKNVLIDYKLISEDSFNLTNKNVYFKNAEINYSIIKNDAYYPKAIALRIFKTIVKLQSCSSI